MGKVITNYKLDHIQNFASRHEHQKDKTRSQIFLKRRHKGLHHQYLFIGGTQLKDINSYFPRNRKIKIPYKTQNRSISKCRHVLTVEIYYLHG